MYRMVPMHAAMAGNRIIRSGAFNDDGEVRGRDMAVAAGQLPGIDHDHPAAPS